MRSTHFTLLCCAVTALAAGATLSTIAEAGLATPPRPLTAAARPRPAPPSAALHGDRLATLLGMAPTTTAEAVLPATAPQTPSRLVLLGTLQPTFAALFDPQDNRVHTVGVGDELHGDELVSVETRFVLVRHEGRLVELTFGPKPPGAAAPPPPPFAASAQLRREEVASALSSLPDLASQVQLVPAQAGGVFRGFRVARLSPDSVLAKAGLRPNDVIRRVNGLDVARAENLSPLIASASSLTRVDVELDRGGAPITWSVALTP